MSRLLIARTAATLLAVLWLSVLAWFIAAMPDKPADPAIKTDAVVVLTGPEIARVTRGLDLFQAGAAPHLLISGVTPGIAEQLLFGWAGRPAMKGVPGITLGTEAQTTVGNAVETRQWACANHAHTILLVTADYHMQRARWLLQHAMPDVRIIPDPLTRLAKSPNVTGSASIKHAIRIVGDANKNLLQHLAAVAGWLPTLAEPCSARDSRLGP